MAKVLMKTQISGDIVPCYPECPFAGETCGDIVQCKHTLKPKDFEYCSTLHMGRPYIKNWVLVSKCPLDADLSKELMMNDDLSA